MSEIDETIIITCRDCKKDIDARTLYLAKVMRHNWHVVVRSDGMPTQNLVCNECWRMRHERN